MNIQAIAAMDCPEHATGLTLKEHELRRTPKELIGAEALQRLKDAGYSVVQRVEKIPS
jgi:hypothetical protein